MSPEDGTHSLYCVLTHNMKECKACCSEFSETYHNELYCASCKKVRRHNGNIKKYGIDSEQYEALLLKQGGVCGICKRASNRRLAVDHCHESGEVRGLLCYNCNVGLGLFKDDTVLLSAAIEYLK